MLGPVHCLLLRKIVRHNIVASLLCQKKRITSHSLSQYHACATVEGQVEPAITCEPVKPQDHNVDWLCRVRGTAFHAFWPLFMAFHGFFLVFLAGVYCFCLVFCMVSAGFSISSAVPGRLGALRDLQVLRVARDELTELHGHALELRREGFRVHQRQLAAENGPKIDDFGPKTAKKSRKTCLGGLLPQVRRLPSTCGGR